MEIETNIKIRPNYRNINEDTSGNKFVNIPVEQVNEIVSEMLKDIQYDVSNSDEQRMELQEFIKAYVQNDEISGKPDEYHNLAVDIARNGEYALACDILEKGLLAYGANVDLLADYLQYGVHCNRGDYAEKCFLKLMSIAYRRWTWRSFIFTIGYMQHQVFDVGNEEVILNAMAKMTYDETEEFYSKAEQAILELVEKYRELYSHIEEPYHMEAKVYKSLNQRDKEIEALKNALDKVAVAPRCALRYADILFDAGKYLESKEVVARAVVDSTESLASVNVGYLYYLQSLAIIAQARRDKVNLTEDEIKDVFTNFDIAIAEFGNGMRNYRDVIQSNARSIKIQLHLDHDCFEDYKYLADLMSEED